MRQTWLGLAPEFSLYLYIKMQEKKERSPSQNQQKKGKVLSHQPENRRKPKICK